jgi:hypothetical protein
MPGFKDARATPEPVLNHFFDRFRLEEPLAGTETFWPPTRCVREGRRAWLIAWIFHTRDQKSIGGVSAAG